VSNVPLQIVSSDEPQKAENVNAAQRIEAARAWLREYLERTGKSQKAIAAAIGYNFSTISQFLKGTYPGDNLAVAAALEGYRELEERRVVAPRVPDFVETSFAKEIEAAVDYAHVNRKLALIYSGAGRGKTMTLRRYADTHPDTIMITANPCVRSPRALLEELLSALGKRLFGATNKMLAAIVETLRGSGRLIIVDEAQHLTRAGIDTLRYIMDETGCGLVLAGNQFVFDRMHGRGEAEFAQLYSRVGIRRCLQREIPLEDIRLVIESVMPVSRECLEYLCEQANISHGGLRYMVNLFVMASGIAYAKRQSLDVEILKTARRFLMGTKEV